VNNEGAIIPAQNCSAVLSTEKESKQQRGVVFLKLEDNNFFPIGVWPNKFADDVIANPRVLLEYIEKIVQQPEKFDDVRYLIPVKLGEISDEPPKQVLWSVTLEGKIPETEDDWVLEFVDLKQFRKLKQLTTRYFQDLMKTIELNAHYKIIRPIEQEIIKEEPVTFWLPIYKEGVTSLLPQNDGSFVDCHELTADIIVLSHFFADLGKNAETYNHYQLADGILEFKSQTNSILSHEQFAFVVSTKKDNSNYGLLFLKKNGKYSLQGMWPKSFFQAYQKNDRILFELLDSLIKVPSSFKSVKFYVPS